MTHERGLFESIRTASTRHGVGMLRLVTLLLVRSASSSDATDWRYFAAGGLSAALSHGYTTPIGKGRRPKNPEPAGAPLSPSQL